MISIFVPDNSGLSLSERWHTEGGVLLIGYDMFRLLVNIQTQQKKRIKKSKKVKSEVVDLEQEEIEIINRKGLLLMFFVHFLDRYSRLVFVYRRCGIELHVSMDILPLRNISL